MPTASGKKNNFIKEQLSLLADPAYRDFSSSLLPGTDHILGVRLPALRKLAKNWQKKTGLKTSASAPGTALKKLCCRAFSLDTQKHPSMKSWSRRPPLSPKSITGLYATASVLP